MMAELGYQDGDFDLDVLYNRFLELADKKGQVFDYDLEALLFFENQQDADAHYRLRQLNVQAGSNHFATGSVELQIGEQIVTEAATGNGPVDSVYRAIDSTVPTVSRQRGQSRNTSPAFVGRVSRPYV